jgi:hypothetical protein
MTHDIYSGLVVTDSVDGGLALVDLGSKKILFANPNIPPSKDVIFGPTGMVAYYNAATSGQVGAVSMANGKELWKTTLPPQGQAIPLIRSLDGLFIVVVLPDSGEVIAIRSSNGREIARHRFSRGLTRPYVTANGQYFLVPDPGSGQVHLLSQTTFQLVTSLAVENPAPLVTAGLFDLIAVAYTDKELYAFNLMKPGSEAPKVLALPGQATDVIITSDSIHAYAAIPSANAIVHLNLQSGEMSQLNGIFRPTTVTMGVSNAVCH